MVDRPLRHSHKLVGDICCTQRVGPRAASGACQNQRQRRCHQRANASTLKSRSAWPSPVYLQVRTALDELPAIQLAKYMIETGGPPIPSEPQGGLDARFCEAMDAAPVMIWVSGEDKLCIWFNRPWLEFTGRAMAQELGNGWAEGVHPEDFNRCLGIYVSHFDAREKFRMQYRLRRHDGEYRWIDDIGSPRYAH